MLPFLLIGIVTAICSANDPPESSDNYGHGRYALAVDFPRQDSPIPSEVFRCLRETGYTAVFFQVYNAQIIHAPEWDPNTASNIREAIRAGLAVEVYMIPRYNLILKGSVQMAEVINYFNSANLGVSRIWIQVKSPDDWDQYKENNREFLKDMISTAQGLGVDVGFYTNEKNWNKITKRWRPEGHNLWYKRVHKAESSGETSANFDDFVPFGNWEVPTVEQFGRKQSVCGAVVNQNVYDTHNM